VPLVFLFTKFDLIVPNDYETARATAYTHCRSLFGNVPTEIVSGNYSFDALHGRVVSRLPLFSARPRFRDLVEKLVATTNEVIIARSRNIPASSEAQRTQLRISPVALAWSVSQRASRDINIQATIECVT